MLSFGLVGQPSSSETADHAQTQQHEYTHTHTQHLSSNTLHLSNSGHVVHLQVPKSALQVFFFGAQFFVIFFNFFKFLSL